MLTRSNRQKATVAATTSAEELETPAAYKARKNRWRCIE